MPDGVKKTALILGVTGQDGSYLADFLLEKGYKVHGVIRKSSSFNTGRIEHLYRDPHESETSFFTHYGDLADPVVISRLIRTIQPDEVYNLGAQSHVKVSFDLPEYTLDVTGLGALRVLDAIRDSGVEARYYQASSSEIFGSTPPPQNEESPFQPRSPYAIAKLAAYWTTVNYREAYDLFAVNGILFNHESPRRGETFVTRKITRATARIKAGLQEKLFLGNLDATRDWGFAPEYVEAMWMMLQADRPDDFVIATGQSHSVREAVEVAFDRVGLDPDRHVEVDSGYYRPTEVDALRGDAAKAERELGWKPRTGFRELIELMVDADLAEVEGSGKGLIP